MKTFTTILTIALATIFTSGYATNNDLGIAKAKDDSVYTNPQEIPFFPGGDVALNKYITDNMQISKSAKEKSVYGKVYVQFVINKKGEVVSPKIVKGIATELDNEAIRLVQNMPKWKPGKNNGKSVNVAWVIPIEFKNKREIVLLSDPETNVVDTVYITADEMPKYPGGDSALRKYIIDHTQYSEEDKKNEMSGTVHVLYVVNEEGKIENAQIERGVHPILDREAIRVINSLPMKFQPGKNNGRPVKVLLRVLIDFYDEDKVFFIVENMPKFPGGELAMRKYITQNLVYPEEAKAKGLSGKVFVQFVINKEGDVVNIKIAKGIDPLLDAEAIRVIQSLPKWKPGSQRGNAVNVSWTVPVNFSFEKAK